MNWHSVVYQRSQDKEVPLNLLKCALNIQIHTYWRFIILCLFDIAAYVLNLCMCVYMNVVQTSITACSCPCVDSHKSESKGNNTSSVYSCLSYLHGGVFNTRVFSILLFGAFLCRCIRLGTSRYMLNVCLYAYHWKRTFMYIMQDKYRKAYRGRKFKPIDLRIKKTRAIRRALTTKEKLKKTRKQSQRDAYYPLRKFAVKA